MKRFYIFCLVVVLLDRASKFMVLTLMELGQTVPILQDIFHFTYVRNAGAAFGILAGQRLFFILVALAVIVIILLYARQVKENALLQIAFALQLGGALGNLYDRLIYGEVVDFLDFKIWPFVFNIADAALVVGVALFALDVLMEWRHERKQA